MALPHAFSLFYNIKVLLLTLRIILAQFLSPHALRERYFSGLKRTKTILQSTMGNEHLCSLALLHIHMSNVADSSNFSSIPVTSCLGREIV